MDNIILNCNQPIKTSGWEDTAHKGKTVSEESCFDENADWHDNAAAAISEEFDDMDGFIDKFTRQKHLSG